MIMKCLIVGMGGFVGTVLRYLFGLIKITENSIFPTNTFLINVIGTLLISLLAYYVTRNTNFDENIILFLKVGICGGFTTFSTFALETGDLIKNGNVEIAFLYVFLSIVIGVLLIFLPELLFGNYFSC